MPITLCAIASNFPHNAGLAFGLTTLALLCGVVPLFFFSLPKNLVFIVLIILILISSLSIFLATKNKKGGKMYGHME